jgi:hypothetical protein
MKRRKRVPKNKIYSGLDQFVGSIKQGEINPVFKQSFGLYEVPFHNQAVSELARAHYALADIEKIAKLTAPTREIKSIASVNGEVVPADAHDIVDVTFDTHYDSIWTRDSCWAYMGLKLENPELAKKILLTEINYLVSQRERIEQLVDKPETLGDDNVIHIRFDSKQENFGDVWENGAVQPWNHKQNDAVGLLLDLAVTAWREDFIQPSDAQIEVIVLTFAYLSATKFWTQADAGAWEESARRNTSSIALCTSAFENFRKWLVQDRKFKQDFNILRDKLGVEKLLSDQYLAQIIKNGYAVIRKQIKDGGESPSYSKSHPAYRTADAALLNVVFPAKLPRLAVKHKIQVLKIVSGLVREHGIIRYIGDTYQAGNFWFNDIHTDCDPEQLKRRLSMFKKGSEAEWFFDSWYSICALEIYQKTRDDEFIYIATKHLNRALGQYTDTKSYKANGHPCDELELPESYNFLLLGAEKFAAASPMTPLNWAKAMQSLMLDKWQNFLRK